MKIVLAYLVFFFVGFSNVSGQTPEKSKLGLVKISIPLLSDWNEGTMRGYSLSLVHKGSRVRIQPPVRERIRDDFYGRDVDVDNYEVGVAPGIYEIEIRNLKKYKLPNFQVTSGETVSFILPQEQFAGNYVCFEGEMGLLMDSYHESPTAKKVSTKPVRMEVIGLQKPFFAVVFHCGKSTYGQITSFSSAKLYYKNNLFSGNLKVSFSDRKITLSGSEQSPSEYVLNGRRGLTSKELIFDWDDR